MSENIEDENTKKDGPLEPGDAIFHADGRGTDKNYQDKKRTLELLKALYSSTKAADLKSYIEELEKD